MIRCRRHGLAIAALVLASALGRVAQLAAYGEKRQPWTTSRVTGSPEPPLPYRLVPAFPNLKFLNSLHLTAAPGTGRLFVCEQAGKILSFPNRQDVQRADVVVDASKDLRSWKAGGAVQGFDALYGLVFHPKFAENRRCYVCYVLKGKGSELADGSRVSQFTMAPTHPPRIDPASEKLLFTFRAGGHNGGCLVFGADHCLYVSTGDAAPPSPPDPLNTGQDCGDLLSSVLRIDVDCQVPGKSYAIPHDNPFVGRTDVRPEIWAFGFRNPWKMTFDRATGDLWLGDVGWELWEMVYRVKKGGNYGWSIKEGPQSIKPDAKIGPTPILPPTVSFPHSDAASITGGYVYRGKKHKDLVGAYICGDWMSRKYWAIRADDVKSTTIEIAQGAPKVVGFCEDNDGELYILDYSESAGIYQFAPNEEASKPRIPFPRRLSDTGLFADAARLVPAVGVSKYSINAEPWTDYAKAERMVALPGSSAAVFYRADQPVPETAFFKARVFFPKDGVLVRTLQMEMETGKIASARKLETQLMHFDGREWRGYSYRWNEDQTDATLVPAAGETVELSVKDQSAPDGARRQSWRFPSRTECRQCHNPWAGEALGFVEPQLRRKTTSVAGTDEFSRLMDLGLIAWGKEDAKSGQGQAVRSLVNPHTHSIELEIRARSYLAVNCAHCHQFGAGGSANIDLRYEAEFNAANLLDVRPVQGTFDIPDARLLAPGDPYRSIVYYRMAKQGRGRMPHIGSDLVDRDGLRLIANWLKHMPNRIDENALIEKCCHPDPNWNPDGRRQAMEKLLATPSTALALLEAWDEGKLPDFVKPQLLSLATSREATVQDLFERFVPDSRRIKRLGSAIRSEDLLAMNGNPVRGKDVFFKTAGLQCATCHRIAGKGGEVGPDLSSIGKKLTKRQLLESMIDPSKEIDAKYAAYSVEVDDGRQLTGLIVARDAQSLTIRDTQGKNTKVLLRQIAAQAPSKKSLMPDQLLRDLTAQQASDLLAYLESLKQPK